MNYTVDHIPRSTPHDRRPGLAMTAKYITVHNTGNPSSTARNERNWLTNVSNTRQASFHIVVDEREAIECLPLDEVAWHAGDGGTGPGNRTSISIEICESGDYAKTLDNAAALVARMLAERGWGVDRLRRHWDWSGKICPRLMYDGGRWTGWTAFVNLVRYKMKQEGDPVEKRIAALEKAQERVPAPQWFVKEFGSDDLGGLIHEPRFTAEGWRVLAIALRAQKV
jgi:N-acetylmuramoyl-L-alanine amidase CwlA